jgi:hypothetical protein
VIICPETGRQAMVEVDAKHAALSTLVGQTDLRLEHCSRWPIKQDCGQDCLLQLDVAPDECLVRSVLEKWYRAKTCAFCKRPFEPIQLIDHRPALLNAEGMTVEWSRIPLGGVERSHGELSASVLELPRRANVSPRTRRPCGREIGSLSTTGC